MLLGQQVVTVLWVLKVQLVLKAMLEDREMQVHQEILGRKEFKEFKAFRENQSKVFREKLVVDLRVFKVRKAIKENLV